jgi:Histidine-specific methyltransferase, SAM-dependent
MNDAFLPITVHASEFPARRRAALLAALRERRLPSQVLYLSLAQAQRWLDYHEAWSPSRTDPGLRGLYGEAYAAAGAALPAAGPLLLGGLGCGGGSKDADLLGVLAGGGGGRALHYVPVDASVPLVGEAAQRARERCPGVALHPLIADLSAAPELEGWLAAAAGAEAPRICTCFGMLPNQDVQAFPAWLARLLRPQDLLLISANLSPGGLATDGPRILMQYDNPPARAWYLGALAELGLSGSMYSLAVEARPLALEGVAPGAAWQIAVTAALRKEAPLAVHGEPVPLAVGDRLAVFTSHRFTAEAVEHLLAAAGLRVQERRVGAAGEEGVFLCRRAA